MVIISSDLWICGCFYLKATGRSWLCYLAQLMETMNFVFIVKHLFQCLLHLHLGLDFLLLSLNAMDRTSRGGEMTIRIFLLLCLWNYSKLIQIVRVLRAWTYKIIIAYFPLRPLAAYRRSQISAFAQSKDGIWFQTYPSAYEKKKYVKHIHYWYCTGINISVVR